MKKISTIIVVLAIYGMSTNAQTAYITNRSDNTVSVINVANNTVITTIPVGNYPSGVTVSPDGSKVYVTNCTSNDVSVINTSTNAITSTITVGAYPYGVSRSPDGSKVYVVNGSSKTVSVINSSTNAVTAAIPVGTDPVGFGNFISIHNHNGIPSLSDETEMVSSYPSPATDNISIIAPQQSEVDISNLQGKLIYSFKAGDIKTTVDVSGLPGGMYFIMVRNQKGATVKKFIKNKIPLHTKYSNNKHINNYIIKPVYK